MEKVDITVIGSGVVGLACAYSISKLNKNRRVVVLEKNRTFGQETSSRNSEVIHAGLYYPQDSLKVLTCLRGNALLYELCSLRGISHKRLGKLVIASDSEERRKIESIYANAVECGAEGLRFLSKEEIKRMEPDVDAESGFLSPNTGIIDSHGLMKFFYDFSRSRNVEYAFSVEVIGISLDKDGSYTITVREPSGEEFSFNSRSVINSAGLHSDKVAGLVGMDIDFHRYRISYCKGEYFRISNVNKFAITRLIYPPPTSVSLGIHVTPDLGNGLRLGPNARYVREIDYSIDEKSKNEFFSSVRKFIPALDADDLVPDTSGIRPKLQSGSDEFRDFLIKEESGSGFPNLINLIGIESPGLSACLAIAEKVMVLAGEDV